MSSFEKVNQHCLRLLRAQWRINDDFVELAVEMFGPYSPDRIEGGTKAAIEKSGKFKPTLADLKESIQRFGQAEESSVPRGKNRDPVADKSKGNAAMQTTLGQIGLQEGWAGQLWLDAALGKQYRTASEYREIRAKADRAAKDLDGWKNSLMKSNLQNLRQAMLEKEVELQGQFLRPPKVGGFAYAD